MRERFSLEVEKFNQYVASFTEFTEEQRNNATIKRDHSIRVAKIIVELAENLELEEEEKFIAFLIGLYHDIGRFKQLQEFNTFHDVKSFDHADASVQVLQEGNFLVSLNEERRRVIENAILFHNKKTVNKGLSETEKFFAQLIRDADKLDILKVLTDYYSDKKAKPNHTLTWEMPKGSTVSPAVSKELLKGVLVSKEKVANEIDIKAMQLSWVYDINFKPSFETVLSKRFLEKIYNSMPKTDIVIEMYRKVKVFAENKLIA